ncbi:unnamed protein product [Lactuca saligna]|uniref:BHLH domain-containing protein n=1 Tax=Lactuca saligna TaxID=75948 RepID=A0AA35UTP2_LACSI|nr:unnamed protein product [Lactuca saligna]
MSKRTTTHYLNTKTPKVHPFISIHRTPKRNPNNSSVSPISFPVMGSTTTRRPKNFPARRVIRRSISSHQRRSRSLHYKSITTSSHSSVSNKLQALKHLIPAQELESDAAIGSTDKLFQETADYILLLRTRVSILQKLVDFYCSSSQNYVNV